MQLFENFLSAEQLTELDALLDEAPWVDGEHSAGTAGRLIKNNLQAQANAPKTLESNNLVVDAIRRCESLQLIACPYRVTPVRFSRYKTGMHYGDHFDAGLIPAKGGLLRTDLSFTLFLSSPEEYEGGELVVNLMGVENELKPQRGDLVLYDSGNLHRVNEVTSGCRSVGVGWIQSVYSTRDRRTVMHNLKKLRYEVLQEEGHSQRFKLLTQSVNALERMWGNQ